MATLGTYYVANFGMAGVAREMPVQWANAVSNLALAGVLTYCIATHRNAQTLVGGLLSGVIVGFAVWLIADFSIYGYTNVLTLQLALSDPFLSALPAGAAGVVIAAVLARLPNSAAIRPAA